MEVIKIKTDNRKELVEASRLLNNNGFNASIEDSWYLVCEDVVRDRVDCGIALDEDQILEYEKLNKKEQEKAIIEISECIYNGSGLIDCDEVDDMIYDEFNGFLNEREEE